MNKERPAPHTPGTRHMLRVLAEKLDPGDCPLSNLGYTQEASAWSHFRQCESDCDDDSPGCWARWAEWEHHRRTSRAIAGLVNIDADGSCDGEGER